MIPLRDTIPSHRTAWIMRAILVLNLAVFLYEWRLGASLEPFIYRFGVVPAHWVLSHASDLWDWPQLFFALVSSQFLHGGLMHLGSNMLYLWIFADNVEDRLGHGRFLLLYLGSGIAAAVTQVLITPRSAIPMVGASGAIAGVLGAYLLMFPGARIVTLVPFFMSAEIVEIPAILFLGFWFLLQWFQGVMTIGSVADVGGVAFWAHIGGFLAGLVGVTLLRPKRHW